MFEEMDKDNEWVVLIVMSAGLDSFDMENCRMLMKWSTTTLFSPARGTRTVNGGCLGEV